MHGFLEQRLRRRGPPDRPRRGGRQGGERRGRRNVEPHHEGRVHSEAFPLVAQVLPGHPQSSSQSGEAMAERRVGALLLQSVDVSKLVGSGDDLVPHGSADVVHGGEFGLQELAMAE